jgi:putative ABC transport system permease protein
MKMRTLVRRELFERKSQMLTCFLAILLGITAVVAIKNVTYYSERAVAQEMDSLGANVLVLPKSATLQDYYSADMHDEVLPEEYVMLLTMSGIEGVENLSPNGLLTYLFFR